MEPPPELPAPQPAGDSVHLEAHVVHLEAHVSGESRVNQAGRDLHLHYQAGVHGARRVKPGAQALECPYPGLASFGREQAKWFFGRGELTSDLITRLDARLSTGGVQVVVAPSGAGKSSLLHAGLLPQLDSDALPGSSRWPTMVLTPTARPLAALATQIGSLTGADPATLAQELVVNSTRTGAVLRGCLGGDDPKARVVVVVDQFEELFTLCTDDQHRRTFIELLSQLASPQSDGDADTRPVGLVVVGVRADFYTACVNYPHLRTALQDNPLVVGPMSDTELRAAILYPAHDVGLDVEPGLLELLLRDLGHTTTAHDNGRAGYEAGRLPLLAHALRVTWQQRHDHCEGSVILWDLTDRTQPRALGQPLSDHHSLVTSAAFSADGRTLVTAGDNDSVILWDLTDRTQPRALGQPLTGHTGSVTAVALAPDGNILATGGSDATVILWNLTDLNQLRDHATQRACAITGGVWIVLNGPVTSRTSRDCPTRTPAR